MAGEARRRRTNPGTRGRGPRCDSMTAGERFDRPRRALGSMLMRACGERRRRGPRAERYGLPARRPGRAFTEPVGEVGDEPLVRSVTRSRWSSWNARQIAVGGDVGVGLEVACSRGPARPRRRAWCSRATGRRRRGGRRAGGRGGRGRARGWTGTSGEATPTRPARWVNRGASRGPTNIDARTGDLSDRVHGGEPLGEPTRQARWLHRGASRGPTNIDARTGDLSDRVHGGEPLGEPTRQARWVHRGASRGPTNIDARTGDLSDRVHGGEPLGEPTRQARWVHRGASRGPTNIDARTGDLSDRVLSDTAADDRLRTP
jgi:hypothetical protein